MGNEDERSSKIVYGGDFQGLSNGGWGAGCTNRGWRSWACLAGDEVAKGDPTAPPPAQRGPRGTGAGLCLERHSERPRGTSTSCSSGNPVQPQGNSPSLCEWDVSGSALLTGSLPPELTSTREEDTW